MSPRDIVRFSEAALDASAGSRKVPTSDYLAHGSFPVVDQSRSMVSGYVNEPDRLYRGDLPVVVFGDHTRIFKYVDFPFCMGADGVKVLRARQGFDTRYLYHALRQLKIPNAGYSRHFRFLKETEIPRPAVSEQRRIADVLDRADELCAKQRRALAQMHELAQSVFHHMFGDPSVNPFRFEMLGCGEVCTRVTVGLVIKPASYYVGSGVPALRSLNIRPGSINVEDIVFFSEYDNEAKLAKSRVWEDDVVLVRTGRPGTAAVIPRELDGANAIDILITTPDKRTMDPIYLCAYFNSPAAKKFVHGEKRGQIQEHLNVASLKRARIPVPPLTLQQSFADRIREIDELKLKCETAVREVDSLFATLQYRSFRAEL